MKRARFDDELSVGENCTLRPIPSFLQGAYFFETRADENEQKTLSVRVQGPASIYLVLKGDEDDRSESSSGEDKDSSSDTEEGDDRDRIERSASKDGETLSETREDDETDRSETSKSGEERTSNHTRKSAEVDKVKGKGMKHERNESTNTVGERLLKSGWVRHKRDLTTSCVIPNSVWETRITKHDGDTILLPLIEVNRTSIFVSGIKYFKPILVNNILRNFGHFRKLTL